MKNMRRIYHKSERRSDPRSKGKMKAMKVTTWDSDSGSESENDFAHICFMVQRDDPIEVNSKSNLNCDDISIDELGKAFE